MDNHKQRLADSPNDVSASSCQTDLSVTFDSMPAKRHRLHHSYIWLQTLRALPVIFVLSVASFVPALMGIAEEHIGSGSISSAVIGVVLAIITTAVLCGISVGWSALTYRFIWYEFSPDEFSYYSGILNKKHVHIPYQRIQSVNQKTSLLQRLLGVCTVEIDTAGGSSNTATSLACVQREESERIRREVFMRKKMLDSGMSPQQVHNRMYQLGDGVRPQSDMLVAGGVTPVSDVTSVNFEQWQPFFQSFLDSDKHEKVPATFGHNILDTPAELASDMRGIFGGESVDTGKADFEIGLTNKELFLAALTGKTSFSLVLIGVVVGIASVASFVVDMRLVSEGVLESATRTVISAMPAPFMLLIALFCLLAFIVLVWIISFMGTCLYYGGFSASRRGNRIEVGQGIVSHTFSGMDIDRIQSITITQSFFQRLLGYCTLGYGRVAAVTSEPSEKPSSTATTSAQDILVVHPFLKLDRVKEVLRGLTPEHRVSFDIDVVLPKKALRRALTRRVILQGFGFWLAVIVTLSMMAFMIVSDQTWIEIGFSPVAIHQILQVGALSLYVLCTVVALFEAIGAYLWYKLSGFTFKDRYVVLINGGFSRSIVVVPRNKVQMSCLRRNPLQRLSGVASVVVVTAQGTSSKKETLVDVSYYDAQAWLEWSVPKSSC